jgi:hypothetical protein
MMWCGWRGRRHRWPRNDPSHHHAFSPPPTRARRSKGKSAERKKHIREFHGFEPTEDEAKQLGRLVDNRAWTLDMLKGFAGVLGLPLSGARHEVAERVNAFCFKPTASGGAGDSSSAVSGTPCW